MQTEGTMTKMQVVSQVELEFDEVINGREEAELLQKVYQTVPTAVRSRYDELHEKMLDETLSPDEQQELIALSDQIQFADVERLYRLIRLAELRKVTVDMLMDQLGLQRRVYA